MKNDKYNNNSNNKDNNEEENIRKKFNDFEYFVSRTKNILESRNILSILFTGVGGQGIILTTRVLAEAALYSGLDVKVSEVHGMAQRGGSVVGSVRVGRKVYSPTVGKADFIVSLEKLEALRYINRLNSEGFIIINKMQICPVSVFFDNSVDYPEDIDSKIRSFTSNYKFINAIEIAKKLNETRVSNLVLLGYLSNYLPIDDNFWIKSITKNVPKKAVDVNIEAFSEGKKIKNTI